jgi:hypothetical protein
MVGFQLKALDLAKIGYLLAQEGDWDGQQIVSIRNGFAGYFLRSPTLNLMTLRGAAGLRQRFGGI